MAPDGDPADYALIFAPAVAMPKRGLAERLSANGAVVLFGPRSGAKMPDVTLPEGLPPGSLRSALPLRVLSAETVRPGCEGEIRWNDGTYASGCWREEIEAGEGLSILGRYEDDTPALVRKGQVLYLATLTDGGFLTDLFEDLAQAAGLATLRLPEGLRLCRRGDLVFALNYSAEGQAVPAPAGADFILGGPVVGPRDASVWRNRA
jgi:beta-galactosidase